MKTRLIVVALILGTMTILAERTKLKPGFNTFSPAQDIEMGKQVAQEAEKELNLVADREVTSYIAALGERLVTKAPNENKFPFTFKVVDEKEINAFALPGGPVYVNRGAIEAADNEAQIAGVMGHEIAHVILRHGTNQASKGQLIGGIGGALGGILGGSKLGQLASAGGVLAANSVLLKYSRDAESQADLMGTQILYDSGYAPRAMAEFFDKLAKEHKGSSIEEFFSNHPIPENRIAKVNAEITRIGPEPANPKTNTPEFQRAKNLLLGMPAPKPKPKPADTQGGKTSTPAAPPQAPSTRMTNFAVAGIQLQHPDNWKSAVNGTHIVLAPAGGADDRGNLGYGMIIDVFKPQNARSLDDATSQFLDGLRQGNPDIKVVRSRVQTRVDGKQAQLTEVTNASPFGGTENDIIVTLLRSPSELLYFVQVAPTKSMPQYQQAFQNIMNSVRLK
jgi:Zn-dependent protease with chaperone function